MKVGRGAALASLVAILCSVGFATQVDESQLKAAFIYNFVVYTSWPKEQWNKRTFVAICVESRVENPLRLALQALSGKSVQDRKIHMLSLGAVVEVADCDVLVLGLNGLSVNPRLRAALAGKAVLTVCDCGTSEYGGEIIRLVDDETRLGFVIDQQTAATAHLSISSKLLRLSGKP